MADSNRTWLMALVENDFGLFVIVAGIVGLSFAFASAVNGDASTPQQQQSCISACRDVGVAEMSGSAQTFRCVCRTATLPEDPTND